MSKLHNFGDFQRLRSWELLKSIKKFTGQAVFKDPVSATIAGLSYKIEPSSVRALDDKRSCIYHLSIDGWTYSIQNESHEYHVLSFCFKDQLNSPLHTENFISDVKVKSRPIILNRRSAQHAYRAAFFIIKKIESGQVPDYERILRLYKIDPCKSTQGKKRSKPKNMVNQGRVMPYIGENKVEEL